MRGDVPGSSKCQTLSTGPCPVTVLKVYNAINWTGATESCWCTSIIQCRETLCVSCQGLKHVLGRLVKDQKRSPRVAACMIHRLHLLIMSDGKHFKQWAQVLRGKTIGRWQKKGLDGSYGMFWPLWFTSSPACQLPSIVSMFGLRDNLSSRHKALWCGSHRVWFSYEITPSVFGKSCCEFYCLFNPSCEVYPADLRGSSLINWKTEMLNGRRETRSDVGLLQNMTSFWVKLFLIIYQRGELEAVVASDIVFFIT